MTRRRENREAIPILTDYDIRTAVKTLGDAGFRTFVLERGTICAYKGKTSYGFPPRHGRFSKEAIERVIADTRGVNP